MFHLSEIFQSRSPVTSTVQAGPRAVVVDNDMTARRSVVQALATLGVDSQVFETGEAALEWMTQGFRPALIALDLRLPRMSGVALCRALRACVNTKEVPLLVYASGHELSDMVSALDLGADAFLEKPLRVDELVDLATELLSPDRSAARRFVPLGVFSLS